MLGRHRGAAEPQQSRYKKAINAIVSRLREIDPVELSGIEVIQHRRNRRLLTSLVAAVGCLAIGFAIAAITAWHQKTIADRNARQAIARQLAAQSRLQELNYPQRSALLAAAAIDATSKDEYVDSDAIVAAFDLLQQLGGQPLFRGDSTNLLIAISPIAGVIATGDRVTGELRWLNLFEDPPGQDPLQFRVPGGVLGLVLSVDGKFLLVTNRDGGIWHCEQVTDHSPNCAMVQKEGSPVSPLLFSADASRAVLVDLENTPEVWDLRSNERIYPGASAPDGQSTQAQLATLSPDGKWLAFARTSASNAGGGAGDELELIETSVGTSKIIDLSNAGRLAIGSLRFSVGSPVLLVAANDWTGNVGKPMLKAIQLSDQPTVTDIHALLNWPLSDIAINDLNRGWVLRQQKSGRTEIWAAKGGRGLSSVGVLSRGVAWHERLVYAVSSSGCRFAELLKNGTMSVTTDACGESPVTRELARGLAAGQGAQIVFSKNERLVAYLPGFQDKASHIWNLDTGKSWILRGADSPSSAALIDDSGSTAILISLSGEIRRWKLETRSGGALPRLMYAHGSGTTTQLAVSADRRWVAHGSGQGGIVLSDTSNPLSIVHKRLSEKLGIALDLQFSGSDRFLSVAEVGGFVYMWRIADIENNDTEPARHWHIDERVDGLVMSADGQWAAVKVGNEQPRVAIIQLAPDAPAAAATKVCEIPNYGGDIVYLPSKATFLMSQKIASGRYRLLSISPAQNCHVQVLDEADGLQHLAISFDGKWLAYEVRDEAEVAIKLRQMVGSTSEFPNS